MHPVSKVLTLIGALGLSSLFGYIYYCTLAALEEIPFILSKYPAETFLPLNPGEAVVIINLHNGVAKPAILIMLGLFCFSEFFCVGLVVIILLILRKNSTNFSKRTYQLHFQFTILLAVQVGDFGLMGRSKIFRLPIFFTEFKAISSPNLNVP
jgi:hypothetical protein